jgi:acyl-CoA reductase-like NAD-dependent aldehyde dehydrogenase
MSARKDPASARTRRRAFAEHLATGISQTEAARRAGYTGTDESLGNTASRLMKNDEVRQWLDAAREKASTARIMTAQQRREHLTRIAQTEMSEHRDQISAIKVLNDMDGLTIKKIHHADKDGNSLGADLAQIPTEVLRKRLDELRGKK